MRQRRFFLLDCFVYRKKFFFQTNHAQKMIIKINRKIRFESIQINFFNIQGVGKRLLQHVRKKIDNKHLFTLAKKRLLVDYVLLK